MRTEEDLLNARERYLVREAFEEGLSWAVETHLWEDDIEEVLSELMVRLDVEPETDD